MKLLRFGPTGAEKPGALDADGIIRDLSSATADYQGATLSLDAIEKLKTLDLSGFPAVDPNTRIGAAIADAPNFFCIGLNYAKHAAETGAQPPSEPILFSKATSAINGPYDPVIIPKDSEKTDWEVELGVVIGREVEHVSEEEALDCVSAYVLINDISEREFQVERKGQWIKGKSAPTFAPIGPWLVTPDEIADPQNLPMQLSVNGEVLQNSNTDDMIFSVKQIISYMSKFMRLRTGDVIATGTPEGVGMGFKPQRFLRHGDVMELSIEGLGSQKQVVHSFPG